MSNSTSSKIVDIEIEKLVYQGWGLGYHDGLAIFVPGTVPGDRVKAKIIKRKRRHAKAKLLELTQSSKDRIESRCAHFPDCGGCQIINVPYQKQLEYKSKMLTDCIQSVYPALDTEIRAIIQSKSASYYRNKMEFSFASDQDRVFLGLKRRGQFDDVIALNHCYLLSELSNKILTFTGDFFTKMGESAWDYHQHQGVLRHLMVRHSKTHDQYMICLIVSENKEAVFKAYFDALKSEFPEVYTGLVWVNSAHGDRAIPEEEICHFGPGYIIEKLGDLQFKVSPASFFQTNTMQAIQLYQQIEQIADIKPTDCLLDLYCGTGTIGLFLAKNAAQVIGVEENPEAIKDAHENAVLNACDNAQFINGRVKNILKFQTFSADIVVIDPPRSGMVPKALRRIIDLDVAQIIYVSCNPTTLFRDLEVFCECGYQVEYIQPVDMFPNTFHIECIAKITKG